MRNFDLSPLYRSAIGFDRLFNHLENNQSQSNGGYPPYNVELVDENHYRIAIAVAGFAESELEITAQDNLLVVIPLLWVAAWWSLRPIEALA